MNVDRDTFAAMIFGLPEVCPKTTGNAACGGGEVVSLNLTART